MSCGCRWLTLRTVPPRVHEYFIHEKSRSELENQGDPEWRITRFQGMKAQEGEPIILPL